MTAPQLRARAPDSSGCNRHCSPILFATTSKVDAIATVRTDIGIALCVCSGLAGAAAAAEISGLAGAAGAGACGAAAVLEAQNRSCRMRVFSVIKPRLQ